MIGLIKEIFFKKSVSDDPVDPALAELGSAVKTVKESRNNLDSVSYFGLTGPLVSNTKKDDDDLDVKMIDASYLEYDGRNFYNSPFDEYVVLSPPGSYPDCPIVMFECQEWIKRDYLKPIGRSRITGETIYKYTGFTPNEDLGSIGINYYEIV